MNYKQKTFPANCWFCGSRIYKDEVIGYANGHPFCCTENYSIHEHYQEDDCLEHYYPSEYLTESEF